MTEDEMVGWHHRLNGYEFGQAPRFGDGQAGLGCCLLLEEGVWYDQCILLAKLCQPLPCFILYSKVERAYYSRYLFTPYFCIPVPQMKWTSFFGVNSRRSCRSSQNHLTSASSALVIEAQTWITVILNGLSWKRTEVILSFLRLHPNTHFGLFC